jgi:hypothetical protein
MLSESNETKLNKPLDQSANSFFPNLIELKAEGNGLSTSLLDGFACGLK